MSDVLSDSEGQQEEGTDIDLTPMLDVVFIMLIFFIVTAVFIKEPGIDVETPEAETAVSQDDANILVAISEDGDVWIDNHQVGERDLTATIKELHLQNPLGALVIQADKDSSHEKLVMVMEAAREAGVKRVAISTQETS